MRITRILPVTQHILVMDTAEHPSHIRDIFASQPPASRPASGSRWLSTTFARLVEPRGVFEHPAHICDLVDPPVVQRLVERRGAVEHGLHIVTLDVSHALMSSLNLDLPMKRRLKSVTRLVFHFEMGGMPSRIPSNRRQFPFKFRHMPPHQRPTQPRSVSFRERRALRHHHHFPNDPSSPSGSSAASDDQKSS